MQSKRPGMKEYFFIFSTRFTRPTRYFIETEDCRTLESPKNTVMVIVSGKDSEKRNKGLVLFKNGIKRKQ